MCEVCGCSAPEGEVQHAYVFSSFITVTKPLPGEHSQRWLCIKYNKTATPSGHVRAATCGESVHAREVYGAEAVDTAHGRKMADHLLVAHFVAGPRSQELRCSAALIARRVSCSDFRLPYLRADPTVNYVICRAHSRATSERSKPAYHPRKSWHPELISGALFRSDASLESDVSLESSELLSEPLNLENCGAMAHHW